MSSSFIDTLPRSTIESAIKALGFGIVRAEFSFARAQSLLNGTAPNPHTLYGAFFAERIKDAYGNASFLFYLNPGEVLVLFGQTVPKARYFSFDLYEDSRWHVRWRKRIATRSSIGNGFNNVTLRTANGQSSTFDAPFALLISDSDASMDKVALALAQTLGPEWLQGPDRINRMRISQRFTLPVEDEKRPLLAFISRNTYIAQSFDEPVECDAVEKMTQDYAKAAPYYGFIASLTAEPEEEKDELNARLDALVNEIYAKMDDTWKITFYEEFQTAPPPELARALLLDFLYDCPDAMYRSAVDRDTLRDLTLGLLDAHCQHTVYPVTNLGVQFELGEEDFILVAGVHYTMRKRVLYFSYSVYDAGWSADKAHGIADVDLRGTCADPELFVFAITRTADGPAADQVRALLGPDARILAGGATEEPFRIGGRVYLDLRTGAQPQMGDFVGSRILLCQKAR